MGRRRQKSIGDADNRAARSRRKFTQTWLPEGGPAGTMRASAGGQGVKGWDGTSGVSFLAGKLFWLIAKPSNALVLLLALGLVAAGLGRRRLGRTLTLVGALGLIIGGFSPLAPWLLSTLENCFQRVEPAEVDGIIVLGGVVDAGLSAARHAVALTDAAERLSELLVLMRRYPEARVVFSGGSGRYPPEPVSEAAVVQGFLADLGVPADRVVFEDRSRNTYENAIFSQRLAAPAPQETWLLVTSAFHMPRAIGVFRHIGWNVVPYPVDYRVSGRYDWPLFNTEASVSSNLRELDFATKEMAGLLAYRLLGRTGELLPGP